VPDATNRGEMPFLDHLEELRWRILYSLGAIVVGTLIGWVVVEHYDVMGLLMRPIAPYLPGGRLMFTSPTDPFFIILKLAFAVGLVLASPIVVYQVWAFLAPALYDKERRLIVPALTVGVVLFAGGVTVAYLWVLPRALGVLLSLQRQDLAPIITADKYFGVAAPFILGFGAVAELPLVITILASLGLVTPQFLARNRRYALVVSAVVAALLSPPDAVSMMLMLLPLVLLYEVGIFCAWVVTRRRARRAARDAAGAATTALLLLLCAAGGLRAQNPPPVRPRPPLPGRPAADTGRRARPDSGPGVPGQPVAGQRLDTLTARKLGLPTAPARSFPASDSVMDALRRLQGFRVTQYVADTLVVQGGDSQVIFLRGQAFVDREGTKVEADSIRYDQATCRLDAAGEPHLFDQDRVTVGDSMRYDTCTRQGTVLQALTDFQQGGATWYMRGNVKLDSDSTVLYGAKSKITSDDHPNPDYHFATNEVKWVNKSVMVARPAVLYVRDVPIMWLPFLPQDIRSGRRSGLLIPRFGLNDLVRPTRGYERHIANVGYYWVVNDYVDVMAKVDWFSGRNISLSGQMNYRWLDRFIRGGVSYTRLSQLDATATSTRIAWQHSQSFDSRTSFNANVDYATSARVVQRNTPDPFLATAQLTSSLNFSKRFGWGSFNLGGSRSQNLSNDLVSQNFPRVSLTPSPINITPSITWSPGFSFDNSQTFHNSGAPFLVASPGGGVDTVPNFFDARQTSFAMSTPLRVGRWTWSNSVNVADVASSQRTELLIPDPADSSSVRHVLYDRTFSTAVEWQTGINLPQLFSGSWKLQPGVAILNTTTAGPFAIRNQYTGGRFIHQGKRLAFTLGTAPTFFGFFPGVGPLSRIRHTIQPIISYQFAPGAHVDTAFARAIDPTGRSLNARSDPQQTISVGLSQNLEGKLKPAPGDTSAEPQVRKLRLLSISTSAISYNFEQAKIPGRTGWQTQTLSNTFASDLIRGFNLQITHDLWRGQVGLKSTKFDPFLTSVSTSFGLSGGTFRALGGLLGLAGRRGEEPPPAPPPPGGTPEGGAALPLPPLGAPQFGGGPRGTGPTSFGAGAGGGFHMGMTLSISRTRPDTGAATAVIQQAKGGRQQLSMNMGFSPTPNWTLSWNTSYDLETQQFGQHAVRLERNLHRWHASFGFYKSANGNFAFNFYISLIDQPDIKFDYDQQTFRRP
jgi:Tat protein translocase TatC